MKRIFKIILPFALIAAVFLVYNLTAETEPVYNDIEGHWAELKIMEWSGYGVITGSYGRFRPADGVTRAEMCAIISRVAPLPEPDGGDYADLESGQWYYDVMLRCIAAGIIRPENGLVQPDEQLCRSEALEMLLKALGREGSHGLELLSLHCNRDWAANNFGYGEEMEQSRLFMDLKYGTVDPEGPLSRAELVLMLDACQAEGYLEIE